MASNLYVGVQSQDLPTLTTGAVTAAQFNTAGIFGKFDRGTDDVMTVLSPTQIPIMLGRYRNSMYGMYAVNGFFQNLQGESATLYVKRNIGADAVVASVNLLNTAGVPANTIQVWAGRKGLKDRGVWGNQLWVNVVETSRSGNVLLGADVAASSSTIVMTSVAQFQLYDWIRITDGTNTEHFTITNIDESTNTLTLSGTIATVGGFAAATPTNVSVVDMSFVVYMKNSDNGNVDIVDTQVNLTMNPLSPHYFVDVVNHEDLGSDYIFVEKLTTASDGLYEDFPAFAADVFTNAVQLTGGTEGTALTTTEQATALSAFDTYDIRQLTNVESFSEAIRDDGEAYCAARGDCKWVGTPTSTDAASFSGLQKWADKRRKTRKIYATDFGTWIYVDDPIGLGPVPQKIIPPLGHMMGYDIWVKSVRGIHKVPASPTLLPVGIRGLSNEITDRRQIRDLANSGLNIMSNIGGEIFVRTGRTPSKAPEWTFVNALDMSIYFKKSFEQSFVGFENEPNKQDLLNRIALQMREFAYEFWKSSSNGGTEGGFADGSFNEVVLIVADESINPRAKVQLGELRVNFYFAPPTPAERILVGVGQIVLK